jgi:glycerol-3-phosphate acyltransferase PlsY
MDVTMMIIPVLAYLLGSFSTAVWVGKWLYGIDVRSHGSGNAGATNVMRILGPKAGIPVMLFDVAKGWLAVEIAFWYRPVGLNGVEFEIFTVVVGFLAVLGHVFPVFTGFKGGKGVATLLGVALALYPWPALAIAVVFFAMLFAFRIVSLSSITAGLLFPVAVMLLPYEPRPELPLILLSIFIAVFIPLTHRQNIKRLLKGEEKKLSIAKKPIV